MENPKILRRYTDIPALLYLLNSQSLTFLDPKTWDDNNDKAYLAAYKSEKRLKTLLAICFTNRKETYHHWRVYSGGHSGVSLHFDRDELMTFFRAIPGVSCNAVHYPTESELEGTTVPIEKWPFTKRHGYSDEGEYRAIYECSARQEASKDIAIPMSLVRHIHVNPWIHKNLFKALESTLIAIPSCQGITISQSSLVNSSRFQKAVRK